MNSGYERLPTPYPRPHAPGRSRGTVVHRFLHELMPVVARTGYPADTDPEFAVMMRAFQPRQVVDRLLAEEAEALRGNPRA